MNTFKILPGVLVGLLLLALAYWLLMPWTTAGAVSAIPEPTKGSAGPAKSAATGPASLVLTTDAVVLLVGEGQAVITATVRDEVGQPVAGVDVQFAGSLGSMSPVTASTSTGGVVTSTFTAGAEPGQATVTVELEELAQTILFQLDGLQGSDTLNLIIGVGTNELAPGAQTSITATIRDQTGRPICGELVTFFGSLGTMSPSSSVSNDSGRVTATFTASIVPGQATLTALAGSVSDSDFVNIKVQALDNLVYLPLVVCDY